MRLKEKAK